MRIVTSRKSISAVFDPLGKENAVILGDRTMDYGEPSPLYWWNSSSKKELYHEQK